ncbi:hypothetical protein BpHYR1_036599 [Brachionus plicatilis]|uniref:Uncharacterized protein n=1 Tax=Brachionus plicatilis TaxID=10195 RepID=A0A3M7T3U1_BRAPC|nr:hypothetical protein BpHYR1_036599 [Brachionus plicatilis]
MNFFVSPPNVMIRHLVHSKNQTPNLAIQTLIDKISPQIRNKRSKKYATKIFAQFVFEIHKTRLTMTKKKTHLNYEFSLT